jgi:hypothetical protein
MDQIIEQAEEFVAYHHVETGITLDYSAASIAHVDALLDGLHHRQVDPADVGDLVVGAASYVGEVIRRTLGGAWANDDDVDSGAAIFNPRMIVAVSSLWPASKVCKRILDGADESLAFYYETTATIAAAIAQEEEPSA